MAEEVKQEEKKADVKKIVSTIFKVILGFVFFVLGIVAIIAWWSVLLLVFGGCFGFFFVFSCWLFLPKNLLLSLLKGSTLM